jgi:protein-S-isoprenylcysteine O-methyltransferase Ste14
MSWLGRFPKHRIAFTRGFVLLLLALLCFSYTPLLPGALPGGVAYWAGFLLLMSGMLGRLWSLLYLSGYKTRQVVDSGPFSVVRNPLYGFSFLGAVGGALLSNHLGFTLLLLGGYLAYYPFVILSEEAGLRARLGAPYEDYCRRVPRIWPRWSAFQRPESWDVRLRGYDSAWRDALWFPVAFLLLSLYRQAVAGGALPFTLF